MSIAQAKEDYKKTTKALDIDYLIFDKIGKNACKKQSLSPDAVMQLGFQVRNYLWTKSRSNNFILNLLRLVTIDWPANSCPPTNPAALPPLSMAELRLYVPALLPLK